MKNKKVEWLVIGLAVLIYLIWMNVIPFNRAPDEYGRYLVPQFIFENGYLPHGGEESIRIPKWGFSYALTPYLAGIICSVFMKVYSLIGGSQENLYLAARLFSVCCGAGTIYFVIKIGEELLGSSYKYVFACLVAFIPQFTFLSSYINNDVLAVFSVSIIIYYWVRGIKDKWSIKSCIGLAIGVSICALSYYNSYGFILSSVILFVVSNLLYQNEWKHIFKRGGLIAGIVCILSGWWFIRNGILHHGDLFGLKTVTEYGDLYGLVELQKANRRTPYNLNQSLLYMLINKKWILLTFKSFIGVFDYMSIYVYKWIYMFYGILILLGGMNVCTIFKKPNNSEKVKFDSIKQKRLFELMLIISGMISIVLSLIYSYYTDFQAQGRYIMGCLIPLMYFISCAIKTIDCWLLERKINVRLSYIIISIVILINIICIVKILFPAYFTIVPK